MKQSRLIAFSLTLFMLLLVVAAGFVFTVQSQRTLQTRLEDRHEELLTNQAAGTRTAVSLAETAATRDAVSEQAAAANADLDAVEQQLNEQLQLAATSEAVLAEAEAAVAAADARIADLQQELQSQQPEVTVQLLDAEQIVEEPFYFFVAASDAVGLTSIDVAVGEETTPYTGDDQRLFTQMISRTLRQAGPFTITVTAVNSNQISTSMSITGTLLTAVAAQQADILAAVNSLPPRTALPTLPHILILRSDFVQWVGAQFPDVNVQQQTRILRAFDMISPDVDVATAVAAWQTADFAALYYDPAADRFIALEQAAVTGPLSDWVAAQQALVLPEFPPGDLTFDSWLAVNAQRVGESLLWQELYLARNEQAIAETAVLSATLLSSTNEALADMPAALRQELLFPYTTGYQWALGIYQERGLSAIAAAQQPQSTTAQVLFGGTAVPQGITLPDLQAALGDDWQMQGRGVWGAFRLQQFLAGQLDDVDTAVAGWSGDQYTIYWNENDDTLVMALLIAWDSPDSADAFNTIFAGYAPALYDPAQSQDVDGGTCWQSQDETLCLFTQETTSFIVRAPTLELAQAIGAQMP
ncbi:MAG: hypothetical protein H6662_17225 [Ardenticatenaceae bacterium]|nr:hypothetical protein [Anaerolineales bacterium]MCB8923332.1 hypothetical protein [Ardenticatenaceae bacterium]MCB9004668.1 hypothetical protein [Ardenticatenaceae bacterium]